MLDCQKIAENLTYFPKELPKIFIKKKKKLPITSEIWSVNLVEFLAKSDSHALNAHEIVSETVGQKYNDLSNMIFLTPSHNFLKNDG